MNIVFDIDGVLADSSARVAKYLTGPVERGEPKGWDGFFRFEEMISDEPIIPALDLLDAMMGDGHHIKFWTGRPEKTREATLYWLGSIAGIRPLDAKSLFMRPDGDHIDDHLLKARYLDECGFMPDLVFEDRDRCVAMYRARGITCYQTQNGAF